MEPDYYENEAFWSHESLSEDDARFDFIVAALPTGIASLLDVGCGNGAFLRRVHERLPTLSIHGAERSATALARVTAPSTQASIDSLPFPDRSFDCVTCLEVIEHLPEPIYAQGLRELARVARRHLIISVPREQDLSLGQVRCPGCMTRFNPDYHLRSFDPGTMTRLLSDQQFVARRVQAYGDGLEYAGAKLITRLKRSFENRFPQDIPCPACGRVLPGKKGAAMAPVTRPQRSLKGTIKAFWPKVNEPRWLLGHYERANTTERTR